MYARRPVLGVALLLSLGAFTSSVRAADQTVLGKTFTVKDPAPGVNPALRSISLVGRELQSSDTVVGDPLANGASVEIIANGAIPTAQVFTLPAGAPVSGFAGWKALGSPVIGYSYKDPRHRDGDRDRCEPVGGAPA